TNLASLFFSSIPHPTPSPTLFPYTTLFRSVDIRKLQFLNDRIAQVTDALNQVRLSVHGLQQAPFGMQQPQLESVDRETHLVQRVDRKSTRLNSSHVSISYAVFCLKKKKIHK